MQTFEERLTGGHPNSLGNTIEIVEEVLADNSLFDELFNCYFSRDEIVRLRTSSAVKRICKTKKSLVIPYLDRLLVEIAKIDQASTQWTLSQLFGMLKEDMNDMQFDQARSIMKNNLVNHNDWIVLNNTMETLTNWAQEDEGLKDWLKEPLNKLTTDSRKSVAARARKMIQKIN